MSRKVADIDACAPLATRATAVKSKHHSTVPHNRRALPARMSPPTTTVTSNCRQPPASLHRQHVRASFLRIAVLTYCCVGYRYGALKSLEQAGLQMGDCKLQLRKTWGDHGADTRKADYRRGRSWPIWVSRVSQLVRGRLRGRCAELRGRYPATDLYRLVESQSRCRQSNGKCSSLLQYVYTLVHVVAGSHRITLLAVYDNRSSGLSRQSSLPASYAP